MFDNGNFRASPFTNEGPTLATMSYSRAVEYKIDTQTMTAEQVWEYGVNQSGENIYTSFIGDASESVPEYLNCSPLPLGNPQTPK